jgi:hypothetical protein
MRSRAKRSKRSRDQPLKSRLKRPGIQHPSDLKEGRKYFQQLVHPLPIPTLIEHWEDQQPLLIRRKKIKEENTDANGNIFLDKRKSTNFYDFF